MASQEQKNLANSIKPLLKQTGFKKSAFNWHRKLNNVVQVINIQGSQWSKAVYINLGVFFLEIEQKDKPKEYDCHIRQRLSGISPNLERCNELLDLENPIDDAQRFHEIIHLIETVCIPWLENCSSKEGARDYISNEKNHGLPMSLSAKKYLGIT